MRVLIAAIPVKSHLYPVVPLAWALQNAGHEVLVASHAAFVDQVAATGLTAVSVGAEPDYVSAGQTTDENIRRVTEALGFEGTDEKLWKASAHYVLAAFARYYAADPLGAGIQSMADATVELAERWKPDLVIWDPAFLPAPVAAKRVGAASARFLWGQDYYGWIRTRINERIADPGVALDTDPLGDILTPMLDRFGYQYDDQMMTGHFSIDPLPIALRMPVDLPYVSMRWVPYNGSAVMPDWLRTEPRRPRVCLSLGVTTQLLFKDVEVPVSTILEMVAELDIDVVATLPDEQAAEMRVIPDNVRVVDYLPLNLVLPSCSALIHHGGFGTFAAAAAFKVPQLVVIEDGGDAYATSAYLGSHGAGVALDSTGFTVEDMNKQLVRVLDEPSFRTGVEAVHRDLLAAPTPNEFVPTLERLTHAHGGRV